MSCLETAWSRGGPRRILWRKELHEVLLGRGFWVALLLAVWLTGYSYVQAIRLYGQASQAARNSPELGRGLSPLDGILVPTFGGLYLIYSLLYPFVVIRTIGGEKQTRTLQLLLQLPYSIGELVAAKFLAAVTAWSILFLPCLAVLVVWTFEGGHLGGWETANLVLGHFLFALVTAGISLVAASICENPASASIAAIAVMSSFWVLDFAAAAEDGLLKQLSALSLTRELKSFESGLFSLNVVAACVSAAAGLAALAGVWVRLDWSLARKRAVSVVVIFLAGLLIAIVAQIRFYCDAAEDRRNSFNRADESLLQTLDGRLAVRVFLLPSDPRAYDLERSVLAKLRRTMRHVSVTYDDVGATQFLSGGSDDYGKVMYSYENHDAMSRSTNAEAVLNLVFELAGMKRKPDGSSASPYPEYPLVVSSRPAEILFYYVMPAVVLCCWALYSGRVPTAAFRWPPASKSSSSPNGRN